MAGGEGVIEGAFINDAAPCHVDEHGGGLHEPEFADTDKVFGLRGEGAVDTDEIRFAEQRGFKISELTDFPQLNIPAFFFYAFRKNHKSMARSKTDAMLEELGGLTTAMLERLVQLYNVPNESLISTDEDSEKNSRLTVEL